MRDANEPVHITLPAEIARCLQANAEDGWHARRFTGIPDSGSYPVPTNLYGALCLATELGYLADDVEDGKIQKPHPSAAEIEMARRAVLVAAGEEDRI